MISTPLTLLNPETHPEILAVGKLKGLNKKVKTTPEIARRIKEAKDGLLVPSNYHIIESARGLGRLCSEISTHGIFAFDTETGGLDAWRDPLYCVSIYVGGHGYLVNFDHPLLARIERDAFRESLGAYFRDDRYKRVGFNVQFDYHFLEEQLRMSCGEAYFDGFLGMWLVDENVRPKALKPLCERFLGIEGQRYNQAFGKTAWVVIDPTVAQVYAIKDAELHMKLYEWELEQLKQAPKVYKLAFNLEMPVLNADYAVEREGFTLDSNYLTNEFGPKLDAVMLQVRMAMGDAYSGDLTAYDRYVDDEVEFVPKHNLDIMTVVNINSDEDFAHYLFTTLHLPRQTGNSTAREVLDKLKDRHPIPALMIEYRANYKLKTAFVDTLPELLRSDGKLHPHQITIGTLTGRSSGTDPNLLQMPEKAGDIIKRAFIAPEGFIWVSKDLKGQELRIQAARAGEHRLIKMLENDEDVYADAAAFFYGVPYVDIANKKGDKRRDQGKRGVLAINYGAQAGKICEIFQCNWPKADRFVKDFFGVLYPTLGRYNESNKAHAKKHGYVETVLGRRRHFDFSIASEKWQTLALERQAINSPTQGSAADQIKLAFLLCKRHFAAREYKSRAILRIHDEIIFWIHQDELYHTTILQEIDHIMTTCIDFHIRMDTTTTIYTNRWGEKAPIDDSDAPE